MSQSTFLLLAIVVATVLVAVSVAVSLARVPPPAPGRADAVGVPARILCPLTGDIARVQVGFDPVDRVLAVLHCERFPAGPIRCDRACFPALDQVPPVASVVT